MKAGAMPSGALVCLAALALGCAAAAQRGGPGAVVEGELGQRLDRLVTERAPALWGAVLAAVDGRVVFAKGFGAADRQKAPMGPQCLFDLGSASQQLTAFTALRLCADGKLRLLDGVGKYLDDWPTDKAGITIDHLLRHTSGLPAEASWADGAAAASRAAAQAIARTRLVEAPGKALHYSPLNAVLLALVIESVTQQRFDRVVVERACRPLGMTTAAPCNARFDARLVTNRRAANDAVGAPASAWDLNWAHRGHVGVLGSVLDVHTHLAALTSGKVLDDERLELLWRPIAAPAYEVQHLPGDGGARVAVRGQTDGYRARWIVDRERRRWVVALTDGLGEPAVLEDAIAEVVMGASAGVAAPPGATVAAPAGPRGAWPAGERERFVGTFRLPRGGGVFSIAVEQDGVWLSGAGLQASQRVQAGVWPGGDEARLRAAEDRGLWIVDRVAADDVVADHEGFTAADAGAALRRTVREWRLRQSTPPRADLVGTRIDGNVVESWYVLRAGAELLLHATWADGVRFARCEVTAGAPPFRVPLRFVHADTAEAMAIAGRRIVVTVEGLGARRRLVFEDASPGASGLVECELADP